MAPRAARRRQGCRRPARRPAVEDRRPAARPAARGLGAVTQRLRLAAIGEPGIELDEIAQCDADAAKADRPGPARRRRGSTGSTPAWRKRAMQPRRADRVEQPDRRHVERQLQRLAHADVALVAHVEIVRPVAAEVGRPVLDQRLLCDQPLFEGEAVDERLQRRARRAELRLVMSIQPSGSASKKSAEPTSARMSPVRASASTMATDSCGPSCAARARAPPARGASWMARSMVSWCGVPGRRRWRRLARWAA